MFNIYKDESKIKYLLYIILSIEHLFFFIFNNFIFREQLVDAHLYYTSAKNVTSFSEWFNYLALGSSSFIFFIVPIIKVLPNFEVAAFLFSLIGFLPFYFVLRWGLKRFSEFDAFSKITFFFFLFMPSLHLWTTTIYKEAVIFPMMFFLFMISIREHKKNWQKILLILLILVIFFIRHYLAFSLLAALLLANFNRLDKKIFFIAISFLLFSIVLTYAVVNNGTLPGIKETFDDFHAYSMEHGNALIDIKKTYYFERFLFMMFTPLWFTAKNSFFQIAYSLENMCLCIWFLLALWKIVNKKISIKPNEKLILIYAPLFLWLMISVLIYNYGLASRYKVMIVPFLFLGIIILSKNYEKKIN